MIPPLEFITTVMWKVVDTSFILEWICSLIRLLAQNKVKIKNGMRNYKKDKFQNDDTEGDVPGPEFLIDCDLFILDDLGTELTNSFTNSALYSVLNERELRKHSTVISTNLGLGDINRLYSERIFSRLSKDYTFLKVIGKDIRCL